MAKLIDGILKKLAAAMRRKGETLDEQPVPKTHAARDGDERHK